MEKIFKLKEKVPKTKESEIYAELTKKLWKSYESSNKFPIKLPNGVRVKNKNKNRYLFFECENEIALNQLTELLEDNGVPWIEV